ncbi:hypothetical protein [Arthrobacter agilis]|uniref:hypothetical protein n=1 Tax=Arthrobacter agilis TaxID=37921 RepID=UPI00277D5179|nr:hypothetical protein [Arthrobacter agilis]MDQ0733634.1 hypothetical protein [Arthrobacter agilis]
MTEPSSAGNPDGAGLPADHPLGPAAPVPPREKEAARADREAAQDGDPTVDPARGGPGDTPAAPAAATERADGARHIDDGRPGTDRRADVLERSAGSAGHRAAGIRDEQGTHEAGAVPAAFEGGAPDPRHRHPEDAAAEFHAWDGGDTAG